MTTKSVAATALLILITVVSAGAQDAEKTFVIPVPGLQIPETSGSEGRTYVGIGYYNILGIPAQSASDAAFIISRLLLPGRERVEDPEKKNLRPHVVELRHGSLGPEGTISDMPIVALVWNTSGSGLAEHFAVARYATSGGKTRFIGWLTYKIKGKAMPMVDVGFSDILDMIPDNSNQA